MAQLCAGHPFLLGTGVHFCSPSNQQVTSLPHSGHCHRGPASQVPPRPSKVSPHEKQKKPYSPWLPSEHRLLPNVSASLSFSQGHLIMNDPFPRGEENGRGS